MPTWGEILEELKAARAASPGTSPFDTVRRKYLTQLQKHTGRNLVLYATRWTQGSSGDPALTSIHAGDIQGFMEVMHGLDPAKGLDLVLHSPGGSPEATESIVKYVRSKFTDVRVIVPHAAMSAATMLTCAANRVVLGKHSFLGPIDPQMILQTDAGVRAVAAHAIIEQFKLAQQECVDPKKLPSWLPILRMYGPALIVQCQLATKLSKTLVSQWLEKYMFSGQPDAKKRAEDTAEKLADHGDFMSHGRFLARDEVKELDLVVDDLEADQTLQDGVLSVFHATTHTLTATPTVKIIENHLGKAFINVNVEAIQVPFAAPKIIMPKPSPLPGPGPNGPTPADPGSSPPKTPSA
jgi:hypothetical protein